MGMRTDYGLVVSNQITKAILPFSLSQFFGNRGIDMVSHLRVLRSDAMECDGHVIALKVSW